MLEIQYSFYLWVTLTIVFGLVGGYSIVTLLTLSKNEVYRYVKENKSWQFILHPFEEDLLYRIKILMHSHFYFLFITIAAISILVYKMSTKGWLHVFITLFLFYTMMVISGLMSHLIYKRKKLFAAKGDSCET